MTLTPRKIRRIIIDGARADLRYYRTDKALQKYERMRAEANVGYRRSSEWTEVLRMGRAIADAENEVVAYRPAKWAGRELTAAEKMKFSRELEAMESDALIQRIGSRYTTHLQIDEGDER